MYLEFCPYCTGLLKGDVCINNRCWRKIYERVKYFWRKLEIRDIGDKFVKEHFSKLDIVGSIRYVDDGKWVRLSNSMDLKIYMAWRNREITDEKIWISIGVPGISDSYFSKNRDIWWSIKMEVINNNKDIILNSYYKEHKEEIDEIHMLVKRKI